MCVQAGALGGEHIKCAGYLRVLPLSTQAGTAAFRRQPGPLLDTRKVEAMNCAHCGVRLREGAKFCTHCGVRARLEPSARMCGRCDAEIESGDSFCTQCGAAAIQPAAAPVPADAPRVRRRPSILPLVAALTVITAAVAVYLTRPLDESERASVPRARDTTPEVNRPRAKPDTARSATAAPRDPHATGVQ